jgi:hypothetical protein
VILTSGQKEDLFKSLADLSKYFSLLRKETDRGCAMIVASHLDYLLGKVLKGCMLQDQDHREEIDQFFKPDQPLGTFAARIKLARYLNIISSHLRKDLDTIRRIRNDFGHSLEYEDFNTPSVRDRCMNLRHDILDDSQNPRERFINTANVLIVIIDFLGVNTSLGIFTSASNPRDVEIALFQDISNAAVAVHEGRWPPQPSANAPG